MPSVLGCERLLTLPQTSKHRDALRTRAVARGVPGEDPRSNRKPRRPPERLRRADDSAPEARIGEERSLPLPRTFDCPARLLSPYSSRLTSIALTTEQRRPPGQGAATRAAPRRRRHPRNYRRGRHHFDRAHQHHVLSSDAPGRVRAATG